MGVQYVEDVAGDVWDRCETCEVAASRERERQWLVAFGVDRKQIAIMQFVWRFQSVAHGRFIGLMNANLDLSASFRRSEAQYVLRASEHAKCVCGNEGVDYDCIPALRLIRADVRQAVHDRFGEVMDIGRLISLPAGWVEWEKAHLVCVSVDAVSGKVLLVNKGVPLDRYLARYVGTKTCSLKALFQRMSRREVLEGYCYLQVFSQEHKLAAMQLCGKYPELSKVFSMPDSWFQWDKFPNLRITAGSLCKLGTEGSQPLVPWLVEQMGSAITEKKMSMRVGSFLDPDALYVKVMRKHSDWRKSVTKTVSIEGSGKLVVPIGTVRFRLRREGFLRLPRGVYVHTLNETFGNDTVSVNVLIPDGVILELSGGRLAGTGVLCSSYEADFVELRNSAYEEWYHKVYDSRSTLMRFAANVKPRAVVLRWPQNLRRNEELSGFDPSEHVSITDNLERTKQTVETRVAGHFRLARPVVDIGHFTQYAALGSFRAAFCLTVLVNDCIAVDPESTLLARGAVSLTSVADLDESVSVRVTVQVDDFHERGSSSSSDAFAKEELEVSDEDQFHFGVYRGARLKDMNQQALADVPGYCYVRLLSDECFATVAAKLGAYPELRSLLMLPARQIRSDALKACKLVKHGTVLHVESAPLMDGESSWNAVVVDLTMELALLDRFGYMIYQVENKEVSFQKSQLITHDMSVGALPTALIVGMSVSLTLNLVALVYVLYRACTNRSSGKRIKR